MRALTAIGLATLILSSSSFADQIQCWRADERDSRSPLMTAEVLPKNTLADVRFYKNEGWAAMNVPGEVRGKVVTNKNSPYPGSVEYHDRIWLFLPQDLSSQNLAATARQAELNNKNSNAYLVVSNSDGEPRGVHLVCYSDIY